MKILMAGDTHGDLVHCQYLVRTAKKENCDRVFILGDFGYWEHEPDGVKFLDKLDLFANLNNKIVYFLDGNHDKTSLLLSRYDLEENWDEEGFIKVRPYVRYARRGHRWTWDGIRFIALGGAYSVDKEWRLYEEAKRRRAGSLWFPEEEMTDEDMARFLEDMEPVDVMLAHDKPRGSNPPWNRKDYLECLPNQDRLQRAVQTLTPQEFWHGHLHYWYRDEFEYSNLDGEPRTLRVQGLNVNPDAAPESWNYDRAQSWWAFDTDEFKVQGVIGKPVRKDPGEKAMRDSGFWRGLSELQKTELQDLERRSNE